jgi:hypothetical protein
MWPVQRDGAAARRGPVSRSFTATQSSRSPRPTASIDTDGLPNTERRLCNAVACRPDPLPVVGHRFPARAVRDTEAVDLSSEAAPDRSDPADLGAVAAHVRATGTTVTGLTGVGTLTAVKILARTDRVERFATDSHFAAYAGVAPREASSGDTLRHRLSRRGDRQLNYALHVVAITQAALAKGEGRRFYDRKSAEGKPGRKPCVRSNAAWPQ